MTTGLDSSTIARAKRVTISDLALALDMTKGTVSRALNGYPDISEKTRTRVKAEAERMGYRPLALAQAIRTGQAKSIGLILQEDEIGGSAPFLAEFLAGVSKATSQEGWSLTVASANTLQGVLDTQSRLIGERKADGLILPRSRHSDPRVEQLMSESVPFVLFGREPENITGDWYDVAGEDAMRDAVIRLADKGHTRIGFMKANEKYVYSKLRETGYRQGLAKAGLQFDPDLVASDAVTVDQGDAAARQLLSQTEPPTAIVCSVDRAALGLYRVAAAAGLNIGSDLSVISYDGIPEGEFASPPLTTFSVDRRHAGERLASILIDRIRHKDKPQTQELVPANLVARQSDGPPAKSAAQIAAIWRTYSNNNDQLHREEKS